MAKANNLELEIVDTEPSKGLSPEYLEINKLGQVPTFVGADGFVLHEAIAIAIYCTLNPTSWLSPANNHLTCVMFDICYDEGNFQFIPGLTTMWT